MTKIINFSIPEEYAEHFSDFLKNYDPADYKAVIPIASEIISLQRDNINNLKFEILDAIAELGELSPLPDIPRNPDFDRLLELAQDLGGTIDARQEQIVAVMQNLIRSVQNDDDNDDDDDDDDDNNIFNITMTTNENSNYSKNSPIPDGAHFVIEKDGVRDSVLDMSLYYYEGAAAVNGLKRSGDTWFHQVDEIDNIWISKSNEVVAKQDVLQFLLDNFTHGEYPHAPNNFKR